MRVHNEHILTLAVAPALDVVSRDDMKEHLRVDGTAEDSLIDAYIAAAVAALDGKNELGRAIMSQTWDEAFQTPTRDVYLEMLPADALVSVKYYDKDNTEQTATLSDFALYKSDDWAFVRSENWPQVYDRPDAITIRYTAGKATPPETLVHAIKLIVATWFEYREDAAAVSLNKIPRAACHLIGLERSGWYG